METERVMLRQLAPGDRPGLDCAQAVSALLDGYRYFRASSLPDSLAYVIEFVLDGEPTQIEIRRIESDGPPPMPPP
jgi:hypothetical protein